MTFATVIVVDSLSTDGSSAVIARNRAWLSDVISEKDAGQADGLNKGFRVATGEIFAWLCADDKMAPSALAHVASDHRTNPFDLSLHRRQSIRRGGQPACRRVFSHSPTLWPARRTP